MDTKGHEFQSGSRERQPRRVGRYFASSKPAYFFARSSFVSIRVHSWFN
jgi:hypothetical protein